MSFWKPLIDWNASHKYHAANRSDAKPGIGIGISKQASNTAENEDKRRREFDSKPSAAPFVSPGDIHGAF